MLCACEVPGTRQENTAEYSTMIPGTVNTPVFEPGIMYLVPGIIWYYIRQDYGFIEWSSWASERWPGDQLCVLLTLCTVHLEPKLLS